MVVLLLHISRDALDRTLVHSYKERAFSRAQDRIPLDFYIWPGVNKVDAQRILHRQLREGNRTKISSKKSRTGLGSIRTSHE